MPINQNEIYFNLTNAHHEHLECALSLPSMSSQSPERVLSRYLVSSLPQGSYSRTMLKSLP
jgi:hypothetical protein